VVEKLNQQLRYKKSFYSQLNAWLLIKSREKKSIISLETCVVTTQLPPHPLLSSPPSALDNKSIAMFFHTASFAP
jgi:hypothetical protein